MGGINKLVLGVKRLSVDMLGACRVTVIALRRDLISLKVLVTGVSGGVGISSSGVVTIIVTGARGEFSKMVEVEAFCLRLRVLGWCVRPEET